MNLPKILKNFLMLSAAILIFGYLAKKPVLSQDPSKIFTLVWSASSFTPPEYEGKALPTQGSEIKVVATPQNSGINSEEMIYRWFLDNDLKYQSGGRGKNYFIFFAQKPAGGRYEIETQILDEREKLLSRQSLMIKIRSPEILISDQQKTYLPKTVFAALGQELKFLSAPLFFNIENPRELDFSWEMDDRIFSSPNQTDPQEVSVKIPGGKISEKIIKTILVNAVKKTDDFERGRREITLEIDK